jgi:hypothetical protein
VLPNDQQPDPAGFAETTVTAPVPPESVAHIVEVVPEPARVGFPPDRLTRPEPAVPEVIQPQVEIVDRTVPSAERPQHAQAEHGEEVVAVRIDAINLTVEAPGPPPAPAAATVDMPPPAPSSRHSSRPPLRPPPTISDRLRRRYIKV